MSADGPPDAVAHLRAALPGLAVHLRPHPRRQLSLRLRHDGPHLHVHPDLLAADPSAVAVIADWVRRHGRGGPGAPLTGLLAAASRRRLTDEVMAGAHADLLALPSIGLGFDPAAALAAVQRAWFADLPPVTVSWGRRPPARRLTHLRFGCYRRRERRIELSPRLARPWVAAVFVEHVLHHELCHHRQTCTPLLRRESSHSRRFRAWERAFPRLDLALRWERLALPWLLDDSAPPWYQATNLEASCPTVSSACSA